MNTLITGISGQTGSYLAEFYLKKGVEVHGMVRQRSDLRFLSDVTPQINLHIQDIRDPHGVQKVIESIKPDVIHHLAAMTYVPYSWVNPLDTFETNVHGTINILEAVKTLSSKPIIQFAGSSEEYGAVPEAEIPITEETKIYPASPYGISKYTGDLLCQQYYRSYGIRTVITRAFNHTSPRRGKHFLTMQVVTQALEIKKGERKHFTLGNLESIRDFSDARDLVDAYYLAVTSTLIQPGRPYNICSELGATARDIVNMVSEMVGIDNTIVIDKDRIRPSDCPILVGSSKLFREATGWIPKYRLRDTLRWMLLLEAEVIG